MNATQTLKLALTLPALIASNEAGNLRRELSSNDEVNYCNPTNSQYTWMLVSDNTDLYGAMQPDGCQVGVSRETTTVASYQLCANEHFNSISWTCDQLSDSGFDLEVFSQTSGMSFEDSVQAYPWGNSYAESCYYLEEGVCWPEFNVFAGEGEQEITCPEPANCKDWENNGYSELELFGIGLASATGFLCILYIVCCQTDGGINDKTMAQSCCSCCGSMCCCCDSLNQSSSALYSATHIENTVDKNIAADSTLNTGLLENDAAKGSEKIEHRA